MTPDEPAWEDEADFVREPDYALEGAGGAETGSGPPPNWRIGRQRHLVAFLRIALLVALLDAVLTLVLPEDLRPSAGVLMVVLLVATPLVRVGWLVQRWARLGDWRFAAVGTALLGVVVVAVLTSL